MPNSTPPPPAKAHLPSEIATASLFLSNYRDLYPVDRTDAGIIYTLIGYQNYLAAAPSGAVALAALKTAGYV